MEQAQETTKTAIRPDTSKMVKAKGGSFHKDDFLGHALAGLSVEQVKSIANTVGVEVSKYEHLNPGQQRMTIGNKLRALTKDVDENGLDGAALDKAVAANVESEKIRDQISVLAEEMKEAGAAAKAEAAAAKEAAKAEKAEAAAAKKAAAAKPEAE